MESQTAKTEKNLFKADTDLVKSLNSTETFSLIWYGETVWEKNQHTTEYPSL